MSVMRSHIRTTLAVLLLVLISGCAGMDNLRVLQDSPGDIEQLLEQNEYARIRQLTSRYPEIDTPVLQDLINMREAAYVEAVVTDARRQEAGNDLLGAVENLSVALQRVPHSDELREMRQTLERERVQQLKRNERDRLIARANYMLDELALYRQQANLTPPSLGQRWEISRYDREAVTLSGQLLEHGEYALLQNDLASAETCLQLSLRLNHTTTAQETLSRLQSLRASHQQVEQKKASIKQAKKEQNIQRSQQQQTEVLLAEAQQALKQNNLQVARAAFVQLPTQTKNNSEVIATKNNLREAINRHVAELVAKGDSLYRADNVLEALQHWNEALSLDPENHALKERIDRANKVLARLEELKRQQP
jgi:tetratricopeptide (TPR) repeat protein